MKKKSKIDKKTAYKIAGLLVVGILAIVALAAPVIAASLDMTDGDYVGKSGSTEGKMVFNDNIGTGNDEFQFQKSKVIIGGAATSPDNRLEVTSGERTVLKINAGRGQDDPDYDAVLRFDQDGTQMMTLGFDDDGTEYTDQDFVSLNYGALTNHHLVIDENGNIGIGTGIYSPLAQLHVEVSDSETVIDSNALCLSHKTSGTASTGFGVGLIFYLDNSVGTSTYAAEIDAIWSSSSSGSEHSKLTFDTLDNADDGMATRMVIDKDGYVGIGDTSPDTILDIKGTGTAKAGLDIFHITNTANAPDMDGTATGIVFNQYYYHSTTPLIADIGKISVGTETDWTSTPSTQDGYMAFHTVKGGTVGEAMRIDSDGNLRVKDGNDDVSISIIAGGTSNDAALKFYRGTYPYYQMGIGYDTYPDNFIICTQTFDNHFVMDTNGNIGMGQWNPDTTLHIGAAGYNHALTMGEVDSAWTPSNPDSGTEARFYVKNDKYVIQFNDSGTTKYFYLDLTQGTGTASWTCTTTAP